MIVHRMTYGFRVSQKRFIALIHTALIPSILKKKQKYFNTTKLILGSALIDHLISNYTKTNSYHLLWDSIVSRIKINKNKKINTLFLRYSCNIRPVGPIRENECIHINKVHIKTVWADGVNPFLLHNFAQSRLQLRRGINIMRGAAAHLCTGMLPCTFGSTSPRPTGAAVRSGWRPAQVCALASPGGGG